MDGPPDTYRGQEDKTRQDKIRQEGYIIPASLAAQMFDPPSGSAVCNLPMPACRNLATCTRVGCHMTCCIVRRAWNLAGNWNPPGGPGSPGTAWSRSAGGAPGCCTCPGQSQLLVRALLLDLALLHDQDVVRLAHGAQPAPPSRHQRPAPSLRGSCTRGQLGGWSISQHL